MHLIPFIGRHFIDTAFDHDTGIVDQNVNAPKVRHGPFNSTNTIGRSRKVSCDMLCAVGYVGTALRHHHVRAFTKKSFRDGSTDATATTGHQNNLITKPESHDQ